MKASIHQPNFIPWMGFFHKALCSDIFVLFDDVQIPNSRSYANFANIKTNVGMKSIVVPINKKQDTLYRNVTLANGNWRKKIIKTLRYSYQKSIFFNDYFDEISEIVNDQSINYLLELNHKLILFILKVFEYKGRVCLSSNLCNKKYNGSEHILHILKSINATSYITGSGLGSKRYINEDDFKNCNIKLEWQEFKCPMYKQLHEDFIPNLSIIDFIFNCGNNKDLIINGVSNEK